MQKSGGNSCQRDHLPHSRALEKKGASSRIEGNINQVIQEVAYLVRNQATGNGVTMRLDLSTDLPLVRGDRVQLQQVLTNLIINVVDARRPLDDRPRDLGIKSARDARAVVVQARDSGTGVDPEQRDRTFEPLNRSFLYYQAGRHRTGIVDQPLHYRVPWRSFASRSRFRWGAVRVRPAEC